MKDQTADLIRNAIRDLAGLLEGGAGITARIDETERWAAGKPDNRRLDLMHVNGERFGEDALATLHAVREALGLAGVAYSEGLDPERIAYDKARYEAAQAQHEVEGTLEFDDLPNDSDYVNRISSVPDAGGYYTLAWVWTETE
jgi:hypothetical protein